MAEEIERGLEDFGDDGEFLGQEGQSGEGFEFASGGQVGSAREGSLWDGLVSWIIFSEDRKRVDERWV